MWVEATDLTNINFGVIEKNQKKKAFKNKSNKKTEK